MKHVVVQARTGMFYGWPANSGIWSWKNEIAVGFTESFYLGQVDRHSQDESKPRSGVIARSLDGGETWSLERPDNFPEGFSFGESHEGATEVLKRPLDFFDQNLALRCKDDGFYVSHDRAQTWTGPYSFRSLNADSALTSRTDYVRLDSRRCLFLLSMRDVTVEAGLADRAFAAITEDGGMSFRRLGSMFPQGDRARSVMPSTVRLHDGSLVSALRRRHDTAGPRVQSDCWIDAVVSRDTGLSWELTGRVADTHTRESRHNGNPPSTVLLPDGTVMVTYGYRAPPFGIRARRSTDGGRTWSKEIVLRDDARTWDIGYPRSVVRPDGALVSIYYYSTDDIPHQHIAATIWRPEEA